ncbi:LysR family transcriptional regulator ArgP [Nocardia cyriacigeorgica]|uniref:HTH-type transcriptional regulator LysG n=1 Tax=Nocardia cyriacigeorgica TaxID=135487 RepID=A0A4U8W6V8_9NOCA|nr:LysR family transcriptional regulator ArgP [Nocardia cyriacigeorgica]MBF6158206.1 LysR family transcriptional regulator ArgP [Nocardia cyriacigeorgica]MBF6197177.1 LysR family transcriptional regulator ArgP [Nocardia cyriacigeorgica]MBF6317551.1 LysR family transcriptional regulator ArgP [Nocardia cyriacigeorgica]MBF6344721.1 LysR family transcriptional regulator ArgP [Nocardia cyriacigeorgica]MBF6515643.1 LysR family transcriptional regulator ArgP [Nocardia cyriacigeorgica]
MTELPFDQVRTLLAVVDEGTFDAAAAALHVTPSAVSQRIKALEQRTGRVLLTRTKPAQPTESGQVIVTFARQIAELQRDTQRQLGIGDETEPARLSIAVNGDSLATWFLPALTRVPQDPPICFELHREDESHSATLLREGQVMAAVTSSAEPVTGCTSRLLGLARYLPVANPEFVARHFGSGTLRHRLPDAPVIVYDRRDELQDRYVRTITAGESAASDLRHYIPTSQGFCDAVVAGLGWGLIPEQQAVPLLRSGALVELGRRKWVDVPLYWQQWKLDVPALALVADTVARAAAEALHQRR